MDEHFTVERRANKHGDMMLCGHAATGGHGTPGTEDYHECCVVCSMGGRSEQACTVDPNPPDLTSRRARCTYYGSSITVRECNYGEKRGTVGCHCEQPSNPKALPFFEYHSDEDFDRFFCGCAGWD